MGTSRCVVHRGVEGYIKVMVTLVATFQVGDNS